MKTQILWNFAVAGVLLASLGAQAQTTTNTRRYYAPKSNTTESTNDDGYSLSSLDLSAQKLPPNYKGNDPKQIYNALSEKFSPKGEFETTPQYQERLRTEREKPLFGKVTINSIFASTIDHSDDNDTGKGELHYDADRQIMTVISWLHSRSDTNTDSTKKYINVRRIIELLGTSVGQNAYGAKGNIVNENTFHYYLSFHNLKDFHVNIIPYIEELSIEVPMKIEVAKEASKDLQTLFIYNVIDPYTEEVQGFFTPTLTFPYEGKNNSYYLNTKIIEIWFYNAKTGEIYYKLIPTNGIVM